MDESKRNNIKLLGTLINTDESGIICISDQVYDSKSKKSVMDRITDLERDIGNIGTTTSNTFIVSEETLTIK